MSYLSFEESIAKGKIGEIIVKEDFLEFLNIKYQDVTGCQQFQVIDTDYLATIGGRLEVKTSYKDNKELIIEDYTDYRPELGKTSLGWFEKTQANLILFVSKTTRAIVFMPMTQRLKVHYWKIRNDFQLVRNMKTSNRYGDTWQSAYRRIPFSALHGFVSVYKKIDEITPRTSGKPVQLSIFNQYGR
jgi:hypothetical protein